MPDNINTQHNVIRLELRLDEKLHAKLRAMAFQDRKLSLNKLINRAVQEFLESQDNVL